MSERALCNYAGLCKYANWQMDHHEKYKVMYVVCELAQVDTLFDYIVEPETPMPEPVVAYLYKQFLQGLRAIHQAGLCHRDIKCENILLDEEFVIKIIDFGYASALNKYDGKPG